MRKLKRGAALTLTGAAMLAGSAVMSSPAQAATSPIGACGGGSYHEIDHHDLGSAATVYLLYNGSTDCVVTWKTANVGTPTRVESWITKRSDGTGSFDIEKDYAYYAGPVKISAPGTCVNWGGYAHGGGDGWNSGWSHCG